MRTLVAALFIFALSLAFIDTAYSMSASSDDREQYFNAYSMSAGSNDQMHYFNDPGPEIVVNRPVNIQGLTGLIITNSAYTQKKGAFTVGLSTLAEDSRTPNFSIVQGIVTATYGATDSIELGLKAKMIASNLGSSSTRETGAGDTDLLFKWRFMNQGKELPAIAFGMGLTLPTGDKDKGFSECEHEIIRLMLIGTHEQEMPGNIVLGLYAEGQVVLVDQNSSSSMKDKYGVINAGILLPIVENNRLQLILEYNLVFDKDIQTLYEGDYHALTPGLRYVTPQLNITAGVQFMRKEDTTAGNDQRYVGTISYRF